ncbi:MAG: toprim domain-containing protein [Ruminococcus sp.]|nr:toprim domain-containing protein [Ruminococcus sp.]
MYGVLSETVLILALDSDKAGLKATTELSKLCEEHKIPYITAFPDVWGDYKDANELLVKDRQKLISNLKKLVDEALNFDKVKWYDNLNAEKISDWSANLKRNKTDNSVKNTMQNLELIFRNGPVFSGKIEFNELTQMRTLDRQEWKDVTENRIKLYLEKEYSLSTSIESISQICSIISDDNKYHPIQEYIMSVQ